MEFLSNSQLLLREISELLPGAHAGELSHADVKFSLHECPGPDETARYEFSVNDNFVQTFPTLRDCLPAIQCYMQEAVAILTREFVFVHAGVVSWKGRTILIPGKSGSGKSTLVMALVDRGAAYYSDEYAVIDATGRVRPYLRPLHLKTAAGPQPVAIAFPACSAGSAADSSAAQPVGLILVTAYSAEAKWQPRLISPGDCLFALVANTLAIRCRPEHSLRALKQVSISARAFETGRSDACAVADTILGMVA